MASQYPKQPFQRIPTNYQDEFIQQIHERYSIIVSPNVDKNRSGKLPDDNEVAADIPTAKLTEKSKMECYTLSKNDATKANKKRKLKEIESVETMPVRKKRKIESIAEKLKEKSRSGTGAEIPGVKPELNPSRKNCKIQMKRKDSVGGPEIDKNCNFVTESKSPNESLKQMNVHDFYSSSLKGLSDTSPFKGKMSAFEISLLKGKQSQERRKSMEAATLRSSPRLNSNIQANKHSVKRSARSLTPSFSDKSRRKTKSKLRKMDKQTRQTLRNRSKSLGAVSPSSIENQLVISKTKSTKRRSLRNRVKEETDGKKSTPRIRRSSSLRNSLKSPPTPSSPTLTYRMNGSPKLKGLPAVISLNSLSGVPLKDQGSSSSFSSTIQQKIYTSSISGTPPTHCTLQLAASPNKSSPDQSSVCVPHRPSSLALQHSGKHVTAREIRSALKKHQQQEGSRAGSSGSRHKQRFNSGERSTDKPHSEIDTPLLHAGSHNGQMSRRSSRSSTPSVSPIKTEMLTPSCTPCSTPKKSPSPCLSGEQKLQKRNKRKNYLFGKYDDVLTRWHDGLYYLGKILKIHEVKQKCLLRYEDNSEYWSFFKDIHRMVNEEEICCICLDDHSEPPNEIVICDNCNQGFHQQCHLPRIDPQHTLDPDEDWFCRQCVFLMTAKVGGALKEGNRADDLRKMKQILPYDLTSLHWDVQHKNNIEQIYCYCGGPGIWYQKMLQCCRCKQWFHEACLQCLDQRLVFGDSFFIFVCSPCNFGEEYIKRLDVEWSDIVHIVLFNMGLEKRKKYFELQEEILPWIEENWDSLHLFEKKDLQKSDIEGHVNDVFNDARFVSQSELRRNQKAWGLRKPVPPPRIQVDLPIKDRLTHNVMKKLQIKGRRSKVFIPLECKSPVKKICQSPSRAIVTSPHLNHKNDGTIDIVKPPASVPNKPVRKSPQKLSLLDKLIPVCPFTSYNHPFKTELEQKSDRERLKLREKIWESFQTRSETLGGGSFDAFAEVSGADGPPVLEKVEPVVPNPDGPSPVMPVIKDGKKKGKSDSPSKRTKDKEGKNYRRSSRKVSLPPNLLESQADKAEINVKKVKSADANYFCAYDKFGIGQGFRVCGRRVNAEGKEEYLINWDS